MNTLSYIHQQVPLKEKDNIYTSMYEEMWQKAVAAPGPYCSGDSDQLSHGCSEEKLIK